MFWETIVRVVIQCGIIRGVNVRGVIVQGEFHGEEFSRAVIHGEIVTEPLPIFR